MRHWLLAAAGERVRREGVRARALTLLLFVSAPILTASAPAAAATCDASIPSWIKDAVARKRPIALTGADGARVFVADAVRPSDTSSRVTLVWTEVSHGAGTVVEVVDVRKRDEVQLIFERASSEGSVAMVNGGYWGYRADRRTPMPLGLVMSHRRTISPRIAWPSGGSFFVTPSSVGVVKATDTLPDDVTEAIQSKPILVTGKRIDVGSNPSELYNRAAVAVRADNGGPSTIVLAGSFEDNDQAMSVCEFAQFLAMSRDDGGPEVTDAIGMDGGPGAHVYLPHAVDPKLRHFGSAALNYVPSLLRVSRRQAR